MICIFTHVEERMKISWPVSAREALVHYVTFDYKQDGLTVVLLNTVIAFICEMSKIPPSLMTIKTTFWTQTNINSFYF